MKAKDESGANGGVVTSNAVSPFTRLPLAAALIVFVPIILTSLTPVLLRPVTAPIIAVYPAFPFLLYAFWCWALIVIGYFVLRRRGIGWSDIGLARFRWRDVCWGVLAALIGIFLVYPLSNGILLGLGLGALQSRSLSVVGPLNLISAILFPSLLVPVAEEIIFRGFVLEMLQAKFHKKWIAGLVGGLMFVLIHVPLFGWSGMLLYVLLWTPLPVILYFWRKSLYPSCIMHILNNTFAFVLVTLFTRS
jgi:membrane protease YdiL (CAAX protease family)